MKIGAFLTTVTVLSILLTAQLGFAQEWTITTAPLTNWSDMALSLDGAKIVAVNGYLGPIYTSTNSGATWAVSTNAPLQYWNGVASSTNGNRLVAVPGGGKIYISTNAGVAWT